jgi:hypothetical protein
MLIIRTLPRLDMLMSPTMAIDVAVRSGEHLGAARHWYRPINVSDSIWHHVHRRIRLQAIDTLKGRTMEHVRR